MRNAKLRKITRYLKRREKGIFNIDIIKNDIKHEFNNTEITHKLESFEHNLNKLIGLSSNSYKKGNFGECILENLFMSRYGDIQFEKKNHIPHSGDAWLYLPDDKIIMIESKNYTTTVNKDEILKLVTLDNDFRANPHLNNQDLNIILIKSDTHTYGLVIEEYFEFITSDNFTAIQQEKIDEIPSY